MKIIVLKIVLGFLGAIILFLSLILSCNETFLKIYHIFIDITPNPNFLSDIVAFEAAIIAFLIPLSIEIVSKLSERYESNVLSKLFLKDGKQKILPVFLLINICLALVLRFLVQDSTNSIIWKISAWILLFCCGFIIVIIYQLIEKMKKIMGETQAVIDMLYENAKKSLE